MYYPNLLILSRTRRSYHKYQARHHWGCGHCRVCCTYRSLFNGATPVLFFVIPLNTCSMWPSIQAEHVRTSEAMTAFSCLDPWWKVRNLKGWGVHSARSISYPCQKEYRPLDLSLILPHRGYNSSFAMAILRSKHMANSMRKFTWTQLKDNQLLFENAYCQSIAFRWRELISSAFLTLLYCFSSTSLPLCTC